MAGRSRRRRVPSVYRVALQLGVAAHPAGAHALLAALVRHLAFAREQCHAPFSELEAHAQACEQLQQERRAAGRAPLRLKPSSRKAIKYHGAVAGMLGLAASIPFAALAGRSVALLLGSSPLRPREVYTLSFPQHMERPGAPTPSDKQLGDAMRRLLRSLMLEHATVVEWDRSPGPTKMFLLFEAPEGALPAPPQGFAAKRAFHLSLRKAFQVHIDFGSGGSSLGTAGGAPGPAFAAAATDDVGVAQLSQRVSAQMHLGEPQGPQLACEPPGVWYQCALHARGLKTQAGG